MQFGRLAARLSAAVCLAALLGASGAAQSSESIGPAPGVAPTTTACELHIWPSGGLRSVYHGWLHGGIVDGAVTGREGYPEVPADPLTIARQVAMLQSAPVDDILGRADDVMIVHAAPLSSVKLRQSRTRMAVSPSPCYAELILEDVFFQEDIVNGSSLKTLIRFRDFGAARDAPRQFGTWTRTALKLFPPREPRQNEAALAELDAAFRANIEQFAAALQGSADAGKKRK